MKRLRSLVLTLALATSLAPLAVHAQPGPKQGEAPDAAEYFKRGSKALKAGNLEEARKNYLAAYELKKSYDVAANLASVELDLKRWVEAADHARWANANFPVVGDNDKRKAVASLLEEAKKHVVAVTIRVSADRADVAIDGKLVGTSPLADAVFVEPGAHIVSALHPSGGAPASEKINADAGSALTVTLELVLAAPPPTASASAAPPGAGSWKPGPVVIAGFGIAGAGAAAGAVFTILSFVKADSAATIANDARAGSKLAEPCAARPTPAKCEELHSALQARDTFANVAFWSFIGAGAVGAGTLIYALAAPNSAGSRTGFQAVPVVTPMGGAVVVRGAF